MPFRLVTYNIHKGIGGVDRRYRLQRVIEAIEHCRPDIVCLQEVDDGAARSQHDRQVDLIGDALGFSHTAFQRNVTLRTGHYGNAILSRFPLSDVEDLDLSIRMKKKRRAVVCHCQVRCEDRSRKLLLFNAHLGLAGFERQIQIRRLLGCDLMQQTPPNTPVIAAGDFNDVWGTLGKRLLVPAGFRPVGRRTKTFPAVLPVRPLDWIFYRGSLEVHHSFASRTKVARQASDHLPLVADFRLL